MWVAKIKFSGVGSLIGDKAIKHKVNLFGFPLAYFYKGNWIIVHIAGTILGKKDAKKRFIKDLKKEKRTINLELNSDFLIGAVKEPEYTKAIYNKDII